MKPARGATPLIALDAVAIDTETTGLDTAIARIIEIGACALTGGAEGDGQKFQSLVNPGIAIPPGSTDIHGITDDDIRDAPGFAEAWKAFEAYRRGRVLIGYAVGFDLAMFRGEAARAGLAWEKPRTLCVRLLSAIAAPDLPDQSLDTLADWLGVTITNRHRALGDALAAAEVYAALLPKLRDKGIRTLAEAEHACRQLTGQLDSHQRARWVEPVIAAGDLERIYSFEAVDPYAYQHRLGEVMSHPPVVVSGGTTIDEAARLMTERKISSLFVSAGAEDSRRLEDFGIITERDLMREIAASGSAALAVEIGPIASRPLISISEGAYVYRAIGRMKRNRIRHLAVGDAGGHLAGIISARDLLKLRASAALDLDDALDQAANGCEMAAAWSGLPAVAGALITEGLNARTICDIVSQELRALTRRAAVLAEVEMARQGHGDPPCAYAVMVLGSGGRGESLLAADQDNAIIFETGAPDGPEDKWFAALGEIMADLLDTAGLPYCLGGVMAKNASWRGSLAVWKSRISGWVGQSRPADILNVDIFFDQVPVHGDLALGDEISRHAYGCGQDNPPFAKLLGSHLEDTASPFTLLGGLRTVDGRLDLKATALFPVVTFARALAIRHGVRARSTAERLEGLMALELGPQNDLQNLIAGHGLALKLMLAQQARDIEAGIPVSNRVDISALKRGQTASLKSALNDFQIIPELARGLMFA